MEEDAGSVRRRVPPRELYHSDGGPRTPSRGLQKQILEKWKNILAPADREVLILAGNYVTKWLGSRQPIIWGDDFCPMKALYQALGRMANVTIYIVDEYGTSYTCSRARRAGDGATTSRSTRRPRGPRRRSMWTSGAY